MIYPGKYTEKPAQRIAKKSQYLLKLERAQKAEQDKREAEAAERKAKVRNFPVSKR